MSLTDLCAELFRQDVVFIDTPWVWSLRWNPTRVRVSALDHVNTFQKDDGRRDDDKTKESGRRQGTRRNSD
jgi:hypothetical protein